MTWSDVDFHKRFIKIDHQLIYELDENNERRFQVTDPKTIKREDGQLLNAGKLDLLIHRIVYECNAGKIANAIKTDTEPELLPNISTHILRHTACTRTQKKEPFYTAFTQNHRKNTEPFENL